MKRFLYCILFVLALLHIFFVAATVEFASYRFIAYDQYYDTRQVIGLRENYFLLFPEPITRDRYGRDIYAHPSWNMTMMQSRLGCVIRCPLSWPDSVVKGVVEADFLGATDILTLDDAVVNTFRLRYAYLFLIHQPGPSWWGVLAPTIYRRLLC